MVAIDADPQSLDPRFGLDATSSRLGDLLHVALTRPDDAGGRAPELATSWSFPDPTTIVFRLRTDLRFPDGHPVTADDVKATYESVLDPAIASPKRSALAMVTAVEAPDPATVVVRLREPFPPLLDSTGLGILPAALARTPDETTVGAGPFRLVRIDRGDRVVLEPNPAWPDGAPQLSPVVFRVVPDELVRVLELERGGLQLAQDPLEPELLAHLEAHPTLAVRRRPGTSFAYLAFNFRDARLANRRVREAIALALDPAGLIEHVLGGTARRATGMLAPEHWAYAIVPAWHHDPRRARRLLDRAGYRDPDGAGPRPRMHLIYKTSTQPMRRRLGEAIQAQLAAVGIAVDVRTYEWGTLFADVRAGNFELATLAWVGIGDPDLYYLAFHSTMVPPAGFNRGRFASPIMDRLTARGRRTIDPAERRAIYGRVQRRAARDLPVLPLWWEDRVVVQTARLDGFTPSPSGDLRGLAGARLH